jgi:hypothetical protein
MANGFDPKRLQRLIATLDEVCAEAKRVRDEVTRAMARSPAHDRPTFPPGRKSAKKRKT